MGTYGNMQIVTAEAKRDVAIDLDAVLRERLLDQVKRQGLHPLGEPRHEWHKITEQDILHDLAAQRAAGIEEPSVYYRAGDWRVMGRIRVVEEPPGN